MRNSGSWFKGLKGKLLFTATLPIVAFTIVVAISYKGLKDISFMLDDAYVDVVPALDHLGRMTTMRASIGYFCWAAIGAVEPEKKKEFLDKAQAAVEEFKQTQVKYEATRFDATEKENYEYVATHKDEFISTSLAMIELLRSPSPEDQIKARALIDYGPWHKMAIEIRKSIEKNIRYYQAMAAEKNQVQKNLSARVSQINVGVGVLSCVLLFSIIMLIAHKVSAAIGTTAQTLNESGGQITQAISQLSEAGNALSQSSVSAAASLEETAASLEEMTSKIKLSSQHAGEASSLSQASSISAEDGEKEIKALIESMKEISSASKKIEEIINVIDDIAFQTNLLALNASVEAARAGEQGKGFAVVADAVRTLAHKSAGAAKDITVLIHDSVEKIDRGTQIADRSGEALSSIVVSVKKVAHLNHEIADTSQEQTHGISHINEAMNKLDQASQSNAASSEEIASTAEEIASQAKQMQNAVTLLNTIVLGASKESLNRRAA